VQADETLDRSEGGMGLGLPLVNMIASAHGGSAKLSCGGSNAGNIFTLSIPLTNEDEVRAKTEATSSLLSNKRLLLIEDNAGIRNMLARSLELKGFEVATASDGETGVEVCTDFDPDISVVDIGLPDTDGYQVARRIRAKPNGDRRILIAVTGYGRKEDVQKAIDSGFDTHLLKPVDPSQLLDAIGKIHAARCSPA